MEQQRRSWYNGQVILGIFLLVMGVLFMMDNADIIDMGSVWKYWPLILVAVGAAKYLNARGGKEMIEGAWLAFVGAWLYVSMNHVLGLRFGTSWPLLVIAWGGTILWKSMLTPANNHPHTGDSRGA